ncbi:signal peptidase I [Jeotgalibacillus haloalkalitolerans]|uniref:Signal peptidase I n=1 Tax=Jeotgalibacillus haloalkalitolerans TaxID=3104292 RepID=A0ABU5KP59_9BACL|nr:signal peptidase I [Jeotgalibacillus sp. HH7-29]MDZ5713043.1 signal peptidase I [Jeotgalibacillus sp. HH7-29]
MESWKKESFEWLKALAVGVVIVLLVRIFLFSNYVVEGVSMQPTLQDGNKLVINKIGYTVGDFDRFDVIVFHASESEDYVKRVIGLPGDEISYEDDQLYINGEYYEEPYLEEFREDGKRLTGDFTLEELTGETEVPEGQLFVLGDNRENSLDSRIFGFIDQDSVVGKVNLRYWPLNELDIRFYE